MKHKVKILFLVNHDVVIYNFRLELVEQLMEAGYEIYISSPYGKRIDELIKMGCHYCEIVMSRHGMNPVKELRLLHTYERQMAQIEPDFVLSYTIKPNIYGAFAAASRGIPCIANVTGLGIAIENSLWKRNMIVALYRLAFRKTKCLFFQNESNQKFFTDNRIAVNRQKLLPGSGVNLQRNPFEEYPEDESKIVFNIIGRLMKDKGIDEVLETARRIKKQYPDTIFRVLGFCDEKEYEKKVRTAAEQGAIEYLGQQNDVHGYIKNSHATLHASYHEGMSNVLLETAAAGRPVIATDIPGCRETFDEGVSGLSFKPRDVEDMIRAVRTFIELPYEKKKIMGIAGRKKMERQFDRKLVVASYMHEIEKTLNS